MKLWPFYSNVVMDVEISQDALVLRVCVVDSFQLQTQNFCSKWDDVQYVHFCTTKCYFALVDILNGIGLKI